MGDGDAGYVEMIRDVEGDAENGKGWGQRGETEIWVTGRCMWGMVMLGMLRRSEKWKEMQRTIERGKDRDGGEGEAQRRCREEQVGAGSGRELVSGKNSVSS